MSRTSKFHVTLGLFGCALLATACSSGDSRTSRGDEPISPLASSTEAEALIARVGARFVRQAMVRDAARTQRMTSRAALPASVVNGAYLRGGRVMVDAGSATFSTILGARASDAVELADARSGARASVTLKGAKPADAEEAHGYIVYRGAHALGDVIQRVFSAGAEDYLVIDRAPLVPAVDYVVSLGENVEGVRMVNRTIELLDASGTPRIRMSPPYLVDAQGTTHWADVSVTGCAIDTSTAPPWGRPVTPPRASTCNVHIAWPNVGVTYPALLDPAWTGTGSMSVARTSPASATTGNGRVLVCGGATDTDVTASAELYDPATGTWTAVGNMAQASMGQSANVLVDGRVLVAGGADYVQDYSTASIFDPVSGLWTATAPMTNARDSHVAATLSSGKVLVAGGYVGSGASGAVEIYDPSSGTWSSASSMALGRIGATANRLDDGTILVAGGYDTVVTASGGLDTKTNASAELYDPVADTWTTVGSMTHPRYAHTATLLGSGKILMIGGRDDTGLNTSSTELYDPATTAFTATGQLNVARTFHTATVLVTGDVLVSGGYTSRSGISSSEVYSVGNGTWSLDGTLSVAREGAIAARIPSGQVLVAGGDNYNSTFASAELWPMAQVGTDLSTYTTADTIQVTYSGTPGNSTDAIAIAPSGSSAATITVQQATSGATSGTMTFTGLAAGTYEARAFFNGGSTIQAISAPFTVASTGPSATYAHFASGIGLTGGTVARYAGTP